MEQRRNEEDKSKQQHQQLRLKPPEMNQMAAALAAQTQNQNQNQQHPHQQPPPLQKCPRCDSSNTKFCYYNNYSLSQPRYFCKACRRYWTQGGTLRNVPVGGGCRKSKRPKPSAPSSSAADINGRNSQPLSFPSHLNQNQQPLRPLPPPAMSSMGNNFYGGGSFLSSLAAMQSLSTQGGSALNLSGQYDGNMSLMQGVNLQSLKPQPPPPPPPQQQQFQLQSDHQFFPSQQNQLSLPPRPSPTSWQNFINRGPATTAAIATSAASPSFWSGAAADGGSSFNPNHWQDSNSGFDPSSH